VSKRRRSNWFTIGACLALVAMSAAPAAAATTSTTAPSTPIDVDGLLLKLEPSLVRIDVSVTVQVSATSVDSDQSAILAYQQARLAQWVSSGRKFAPGADARQALIADTVDEVVANPPQYLKSSGKPVEDNVPVTTISSGVIVTSTGVILTAASAVPDDKTIEQGVLLDYKDEASALDLDQSADDQVITGLTAEQLAKLQRAAGALVASTLSAKVTERTITVQTGPATPDMSGDHVYRATVVTSGDPTREDALALLSIDAKGPLLPAQIHPTPDLGAKLVSLGYPADDRDVEPDPGPLIAPQGAVGEPGPTLSGAVLTSFSLSPGRIGGPVVDAAGDVVGITTHHEAFGATIAVDRRTPILQQANLPAPADAATKTWADAIKSYRHQHFKHALAEFRVSAKQAPSNPYAGPLAADAAQSIALGKDRTPRSRPWLAAALAGVLILAVMTALLLRQRNLRWRRR
jgi:S1-C subfamily serine protease